MNLFKETFQEHNFIWTQWKKARHYHFLKMKQDVIEGSVSEQ